jgi:hypothetical protein
MQNVIMLNVVAPEKPALDKHSSLLQTNTLAYLAPLSVTKEKKLYNINNWWFVIG